MNEDLLANFQTLSEDDRVRYVGGTRQNLLKDKIGVVRAVRYDSRTSRVVSAGVAFEGFSELVWASAESWRKLPQLIKQDFDIEKVFTDAAGGPLAVARAELARLEARVAELKSAIRVIESL